MANDTLAVQRFGSFRSIAVLSRFQAAKTGGAFFPSFCAFWAIRAFFNLNQEIQPLNGKISFRMVLKTLANTVYLT